MAILTDSEWNVFLAQHSDAHLLQTSAWGALKSKFGWQVERVCAGACGAQVLFRRLPLGLSLAYIPKGPVGEGWAGLWPEVDRLCRRRRAVLLKVEPDLSEPMPQNVISALRGFRRSKHAIQPRRSIVIRLDGTEEEWLARMKQKTRYNIRLAEKKEVLVRPSGDLDAFYRLMQATGQRDGFGVHSLDYFRAAHDLFSPAGACRLWIAEYAGRPLAGIMVFARGSRAWYFYGASSEEERGRMPAYLLQWHAMRWAKSIGCAEYDLWGVPDEEDETLEASFETRSDGLWGVYRFKRGFGGSLVRSVGAFDRPYLLPLYPLYRWWASRRGDAR
jgi:lipid II:glycine glycyltransferase (peptidoglycan interpeptide bridge formation enzyme)